MSGLRLSEIVIGKRHRRDMGDVAGLAKSIEEVGLLHPVVVTTDNRLIAGQRRLEAVKYLKRSEVEVTRIDLDAILDGEIAENRDRLDLSPEESVDLGLALEARERQRAKERQGERTDKHPGKFPEGSDGRARDKVAKCLGVSGKTYEKRKKVVLAARAEPKKHGKALADMNRTKRVHGPYKRVVVAEKAEAIREEPPPLPGKGPYRVIVADPPWPYELRKADPSHRATHPYPQMSLDQIRALPVASIAHGDCILWLWTTNHHMREAFTVLDAWGFVQKTILTWVKSRFGTGDWLRGQTEHCLLAVRGKPTVHLTNQTTVLHGPLRKNSQKPDEFYPFVEKLCPAPRYAELFQRAGRANWDGHGDEVGHAPIP